MSKFSKYLFIVLSLHCISCQPKNDDKTNSEGLNGLWGVTYSNSDRYQEILIKDSLFALADDDLGIVYRQLDLRDDSIKLYHDFEIYLTGKVDFISSNGIEITFNDFTSELIRIDKYLLSDSIMKIIIEGRERNEVLEQLWWERFRAREAEWSEEGKE
ncbi:MAG TPA: hypothetical protein PLJ08_18350 [Cyclobacteriaceae bacterium]|nr:hypothetical protein [Cyclobacteriaceae bacterium]